MLRCLLDGGSLGWLLGPGGDDAHDAHRLAWLAEAQRQRATLLIPAAVLADWLVEVGTSGEAALKALRGARPVEVVAFDERAARELVRLQTFAAANDDERWWRASREQRHLVALAVVRQAALVGEAQRLDAAAAMAGVAFISMGDIASLGAPPQLALPLNVPALFEAFDALTLTLTVTDEVTDETPPA